MDQPSPYSCWHAHWIEQSVFLKFSSMMQLRFVILSLCTLVMSSTLAAQVPLVANPLALSKDSTVQRIIQLHEKTLDLSKVVLNGEKAFFQSQAEIGRLHQTMNGLLIERGWSFEEAISNQDQNPKRAARIHENMPSSSIAPLHENGEKPVAEKPSWNAVSSSLYTMNSRPQTESMNTNALH